MNGKLVHRVALALIPVGLLTTVSLALSLAGQPPFVPPTGPSAEDITEEAPAPVVVAQQQPVPPPAQQPPAQQPAQTQPQAPPPPAAPVTEEQAPPPAEAIAEPLPQLVVDKTALQQAMVELDLAIEQTKLAVTALDAASQNRYVQEAINRLAGFQDAAFRSTTTVASADAYRGVRPLLIEARVAREAAETQWLAAVQRQVEASHQRLAEIAQAGQPTGGTVPQPQPPAFNVADAVGPTGILGTRGVRPEEQATELVSRAIRQLQDVLRLVPEPGFGASASEQSTVMLESIVRTLETAKKIVQIAIDR